MKLCEATWRDIQSIGIYFRKNGIGITEPKHPVVGFTKGVLELPSDYWVDVVEALWDGGWRHAEKPLAWVKKVAINKAKRRKGEDARGSYAVKDGHGRPRPVYEIEQIPEEKRSGPCKTLMKEGRRLDEPTYTPARTERRKLAGNMVAHDPGVEDSDPGAGDDDGFEVTVWDRVVHGRYQREDAEARFAVDWWLIEGNLDLDPEERALFRTVVNSAWLNHADPRTILGWDYPHFDRVRKRLQRKREAIKQAIENKFSQNVRNRAKTDTT